MDYKKTITNYSELIIKQFRYSLRIIFANKFIYFLSAAVIFFLIVVVINLFSTGNTDARNV
jgi:hypothetical protein